MTTLTPALPAAGPAFRDARVADAMTRGVIRCSPETPLAGVASLMAENAVHAIFVFDYGAENDETVALWGIVSDLDLVAAANADIEELTARHSAITPLVTIRTDDLLGHAAQRMAETGVSHLAVLDPLTGRPAGVLSTLDVIRYVAAGRERRARSSTAQKSPERTSTTPGTRLT